MHIRCSYCSHTFNLSRDFLVMAIGEATERGQKYYGVECINCRKLIKVPVAQMRHHAPAPAEVEGEEPAT